MNKKKLLSIVLIIVGIILPLSTLPLSSEYYSEDSFFWNIVRNVVTGQVIIRKSIFEVAPDRDEDLYREFHAYNMKHPEYRKLPKEEIIEKFYQETYRDNMSGMQLRLKLQKQKVVTHQSKIVIPYRYIFVSSVILIFIGTGIISFLKIKDKKKV
jgi:hypothetical protein